MKQLVILEMKKINMKVMGMLGIAAGSVSFVYLILTSLLLKGKPAGLDQYFFRIITYNKIAFTIFTAVLIHKMFSEELSSRSISILFTYPISRMKLLITKVVLIIAVVLPFMYISMVLQLGITGLAGTLFHWGGKGMDMQLFGKYMITALVQSILAMIAAFIPMFIDVKFASTQYTLLSAGIMAMFLYGISNNIVSAAGYVLMAAAAIMGVVMIKKSLDYVVQKDIM